MPADPSERLRFLQQQYLSFRNNIKAQTIIDIFAEIARHGRIDDTEFVHHLIKTYFPEYAERILLERNDAAARLEYPGDEACARSPAASGCTISHHEEFLCSIPHILDCYRSRFGLRYTSNIIPANSLTALSLTGVFRNADVTVFDDAARMISSSYARAMAPLPSYLPPTEFQTRDGPSDKDDYSEKVDYYIIYLDDHRCIASQVSRFGLVFFQVPVQPVQTIRCKVDSK